MFVDGPRSPPKPPSPRAKIDRFVLHSGLPSRSVTNVSMTISCALPLSQISANRVTDRPTRWPARPWHCYRLAGMLSSMSISADVAEGAAPAGVVDQGAQLPQKLQLASPFSPSRLPGISCHDREFRAGWLPHLGTKCDLRLAEMSHAKASSEGEKAKCIATTLM